MCVIALVGKKLGHAWDEADASFSHDAIGVVARGGGSRAAIGECRLTYVFWLRSLRTRGGERLYETLEGRTYTTDGFLLQVNAPHGGIALQE
jgi:hypothetical protein